MPAHDDHLGMATGYGVMPGDLRVRMVVCTRPAALWTRVARIADSPHFDAAE
jgi:hypothetical protein